MSQDHLSDLRFDSLTLDERVQAGIRDAGFEYCLIVRAASSILTVLVIGSPQRTLKMDDAALTIRQYVAALSRVFRGYLQDSVNSENGWSDDCRVGMNPI